MPLLDDVPLPDSNLTGTWHESDYHIPGRRVFGQVAAERGLRPGAWRLRVHRPAYVWPPADGDESGLPEFQWSYDGTLRLEEASDDAGAPAWVCSGDLYFSFEFRHDDLGGVPGCQPVGESESVPGFARQLYAGYLAVTQLVDRAQSSDLVRLGFDLMRIRTDTLRWNAGEARGPFRADLAASRDAGGAVTALAGKILDADDATFGQLELTWICPTLRRCRIEVQRTPGVPEVGVARDAGGLELRLAEAFAAVGWDVEFTEEEIEAIEPRKMAWDDMRLHRTMLGWRKGYDLDRDWTYHLLAVPEIEGAPRGVMYDAEATDSNSVPREGAAVERSGFFGDGADFFDLKTPPEIRHAGYLRTAIHEIGHAMGLDHNTDGKGFMCTTDTLLSSGAPFWDCVDWAFHEEDRWRLCHWPDSAIRPGGIPVSVLSDASEVHRRVRVPPRLTLQVDPVAETGEFPLGVPVRLELTLRNDGDAPVDVRFDGDVFSGRVLDLRATARRFRPLNRCHEGRAVKTIPAHSTLGASLVLMRGPDGALFGEPGLYRIEVLAEVGPVGRRSLLAGFGEVRVTEPATAAEEKFARELLDDPEVFPLGAMAGVVGPAGRRILREPDAVRLRPHLAGFEIRRLTGRRVPPVDEIDDLRDGAVLTSAETSLFETRLLEDENA